MNRDVAIIGIGLSKIGERWESSLQDLFVEAATRAMKDAGVDTVDALHIGCMSSGLFNNQEHIGAMMADFLGMAPSAASRLEAAEASGALAIKSAILDVASGNSEIVLAGGVEKTNDIDGEAATGVLTAGSDATYEGYQGITNPGIYAMMAKAHMERYGTTREQLAEVAVKNHFHGSMNKGVAQLPFPIKAAAVIGSPLVADPLRMLDCSPLSDGAAAVIVCSMEKARAIAKHPIVSLKGMGHATDTLALHARKDVTVLNAVWIAAEKAYHQAGIQPADVDVAEVHDVTTITEIMALEALGFAEPGQGGSFTEAGHTRLGGKIPVNTSGGCKSFGHPLGATGAAQVVEIVQQLRGAAGDRQVNNARIGLTQSIGGSGATAIVHIWEVK